MQCRNWARHNRLTALGTVMCLLAAVFFVEAKLAWYSPDSTARVELSAGKLRADDAPKLVASAPLAPAPLPDLLPQGTLIGAFVFLAAIAFYRLAVRIPAETMAVAAGPGSFPPLYLRPPPRR